MSSSAASSDPTYLTPQPFKYSVSIDEEHRILDRLIWSSSFESFLATKYPNDKHHNSLSNIKHPRRDTATFANEGPPDTYLSLGDGKGRKEAVNVIMGKDDRLLIVVERRLHCSDTKDFWTRRNTSPVIRVGQAAQSKSTMEEMEEEDGAILNKYKMTVVLKKLRA
ncbi:hypothetical protein QR685DRAFT_557430 [Neurospora intermedia]|uniref:Uncharacterized protein n=1 Tax=Neurospora intermedia TaxID=5142 RepID=A0ABR3CZX6_NEUIN